MQEDQDPRYWNCQNRQGQCCRQCCYCPAYPPAPAGTGCLSGIQLQLHGASDGLLEHNGSILFDTVVNQPSPDISYSSLTGEFLLPAYKSFYVSWWVAVDGTDANKNIEFAIAVNHIPVSIGSAPQVTYQLTGSGLVTTGSSPELVTVMNVSGNTVKYAAASVQANIVILESV